VIVEKVLCSMTSKFNYVVFSIEESNDVTTLTIGEPQSSLLVHEQRMQSQLVKDEEQALKVFGRGNGRGRGGRIGFRVRGRGRQGKEFVERFKCYTLGHYQNECPSWGENDANYAAFDDSEEMLLMAQHANLNQAKDEVWFLDSGCSNHMVGSKDWLFDFDDSFRSSVKLGNDSKMHVMGKGNLKLFIGGIVQVI